MLVVRAGVIRLCVNGENNVLNKNEGAFINSNVLHSAHTVLVEAGAGCVINSLVFHASLISGAAESVFERRYVRPVLNCSGLLPLVRFDSENEWHRQAAECVKDAYEAYDAEEYAAELVVREKLSRLWYLLVKNTQSILTKQDTTESQDVARIKAMINYMHSHYPEALTVSRIAAAVNISERSCLRCFRKTVGMSPMQYLLKYRVSVASRMLAETNMTIAEICAVSGFETASYFTKIFKRFMSCKPSDYRKSVCHAI